MRREVRPRQCAGKLRQRTLQRRQTKAPSFAVAWLRRATRPIDGPTVESRRRSRLEQSLSQAKLAQLCAEPNGRGIPDAAPAPPFGSAKQVRAKEGARREYNCASLEIDATFRHRPNAAAALNLQPLDRTFNEFDIMFEQKFAHGLAEQVPIRLHTRAPDSAALASIEHSAVNRGAVGGPRHDSAKRVNLADQMALADTPD
jgi:hypothetical protein